MARGDHTQDCGSGEVRLLGDAVYIELEKYLKNVLIVGGMLALAAAYCIGSVAVAGGLTVTGTIPSEAGTCNVLLTRTPGGEPPLSSIRVSGAFRVQLLRPQPGDNYRVSVACGGIVRLSARVPYAWDSVNFGIVQLPPPELTQAEKNSLAGIPALIFDVLGGLRYSLHLYDNGHFGIAFLHDYPGPSFISFGKIPMKDYEQIIEVMEKHDFMNHELPWKRQPDGVTNVDCPCPAKLTYYKNKQFKIFYGDQSYDPILGDLTRAIEDLIRPGAIAIELSARVERHGLLPKGTSESLSNRKIERDAR